MKLSTILLSVLTLLSSCQTIIHGTKQKISIDSNIEKAEIYIDNEYVGVTPFKKRIKRQEKPLNITLSKDGYDSATYVIPSYKRLQGNAIVGNVILGGIVGALGSSMVGATNSEETFGLNLGIQATGITAAFLIDKYSGAKYQYLNSELNLPIYKKPDTIKVETDLIFCTSVSVDLKEGEEAGKVKYGNISKEIDWQEDITFQDFELEKTVNTELDKYGFKVPDFEVKGALQPILLPRYILKAEVTKVYNHVTFNIGQRSVARERNAEHYALTTDLEVTWKVLKRKTEEVLIEKAVKVQNYTPSKEVRDAFKKTFEYSFYQFLNITPEFYELVVKKKSQRLTTSVSIPDGIPVSNEAEDWIQSAVTVNTNTGHGSGFAISEDGYIITNFHVVADVDTLEVILSNNEKYEAKLINFNSERDLALLKIDHTIKPLPLSKESVKLGASVIAIGTPADIALGQTLSKGMISGKRKIDEKQYLQSDVSISPGNSGGPLLYEGKVIGIVDAKMVGNGIEGITFIIPINEIFRGLNIKYSSIN
ncbi:trypsin-like peptidase domain-containing protein [Limibacter armeniacum]|uniref:S1C family serine protease n=1 Tax=Limibacter armeniacum TaxID=466084 RepID=UPI002FE66D59